MKKGSFVSIGTAVMLLAGLAHHALSDRILSHAEEGEEDGFFVQTAARCAYGDMLSAPAYQGENGRFLLWKQDSASGEMHRRASLWSSDEGETCATVSDGYRYTPKGKSIVWEWRAPHGGVAAFSGIVYNYFAFTSDADLTEYGTSARSAAADSGSRDGVTLSVSYVSGTDNAETLYRKTLDDDFCLFADEKDYRVSEGDRFRICIDAGENLSYDDVCLYLNVSLDEKVVAYDFTAQADYADYFVTDLTGNGNDLSVKDRFENPEADAEKGLRFDGNSEHFLYDLNHTKRDFTDDLVDFSVRVKYTIGPGNNDWKYIFSTTSHEGTMSTRGIGLTLNSIAPTADGKKQYCLQIRADQEGDPDFFAVTNGWTNGLVEGETYQTVINVSTTEKKIEAFTTGKYAGNWIGTNASGGGSAMRLEESWTMDNPNAHGLVIGAFNEAGEQAFDGWISSFEIGNYYVSYDGNSAGNGPFRASELKTSEAESLQPLAALAFAADGSELLASAPQEATVNLSGGKTVSAKVLWSDVIYDGSEYYLLGKIRNGGFKANCLTVKAPVTAYIADLVCDDEFVGFIACATDGGSELVFPSAYPFAGEGYDVLWYTDKTLETVYNGGAATESFKLYADVKLHVYTVAYELNGGENSSANPASYTVLDDRIALGDPTREGYEFKGWYLESDFQTKVNMIDPAQTSDVVLFAKWEANPQGGGDEEPGTEEESGDGCRGSVIGIGTGAAVFAAGGSVLLAALLKRRTNQK